MQHRFLAVLAAVMALSMLACGLTEGLGDLVAGIDDATQGTDDIVERLDDLDLDDLDPEDLEDLEGLDDIIEDLGELELDDDLAIPPSVSLGELPEGYPEQEFPVYEGADATILGGGKQEIDDGLFYNVVVGTNDDTETVEQAIRDTFEEASDEFEEMVGGGTFIGVKGAWQYAIVVSGESDGYQALITYAIERE